MKKKNSERNKKDERIIEELTLNSAHTAKQFVCHESHYPDKLFNSTVIISYLDLLRESLGEFEILLHCSLTASVPKAICSMRKVVFRRPAVFKWLQLKSTVIKVLEVSVSYAKFNDISSLFCTSLIEFCALRKQITAIFLDFIYLRIIFYIIFFSAARCLALLLT